jgi:predicted Zn-dependent protease
MAVTSKSAAALKLSLLAWTLVLIQCAGFFKGAGEALVSEQDEVKLGAEFNNTLRTNDTAKQEFPLFVPTTPAQADFQNYVLGVCNQTLAAVPASERPAYPFTFTLINKDVENAFAVPGGYVYIYTGILKKLQDESELAGIVGHEITHVTHHHYRESLAKQATLGLALQAVLGATNAGQVTQMAAGTAFQLAGLKFSRSNEADADKGGTALLARTGHNPLGIAKYFARNNGPRIPEWLADHPGAHNRVSAVEKQVKSHPDMARLAQDSASTNFKGNFVSHMQGT